MEYAGIVIVWVVLGERRRKLDVRFLMKIGAIESLRIHGRKSTGQQKVGHKPQNATRPQNSYLSMYLATIVNSRIETK